MKVNRVLLGDLVGGGGGGGRGLVVLGGTYPCCGGLAAGVELLEYLVGAVCGSLGTVNVTVVMAGALGAP